MYRPYEYHLIPQKHVAIVGQRYRNREGIHIYYDVQHGIRSSEDRRRYH